MQGRQRAFRLSTNNQRIAHACGARLLCAGKRWSLRWAICKISSMEPEALIRWSPWGDRSKIFSFLCKKKPCASRDRGERECSSFKLGGPGLVAPRKILVRHLPSAYAVAPVFPRNSFAASKCLQRGRTTTKKSKGTDW
jgi:hypothetical protein